jgi:hypothetical protein
VDLGYIFLTEPNEELDMPRAGGGPNIYDELCMFSDT